MDFSTHLVMLGREANMLGRAAARAGWHAKVPSCPDWTSRDLVHHIGRIHRWAARHVLEQRTEDDIELAGLPDDDALQTWYAEGQTILVDALAEAGPESPGLAFPARAVRIGVLGPAAGARDRDPSRRRGAGRGRGDSKTN